MLRSITLVHLEKICFAADTVRARSVHSARPRVPVAACDCARVCGSPDKRYELLRVRPPILASAALLGLVVTFLPRKGGTVPGSRAA